MSDPMRLDMSWLVQADNVNITDTGALTKREGYALSRAGAFKSAYNTLDFSRLYLATDSGIQDFTGAVLAPITEDSAIHWAEVNEQVFYNNGVDSGIILPDNSVIPWRWKAPNTPTVSVMDGSLPAGTYQVCCTGVLPDGRETGATQAVTIQLQDKQGVLITGLTPGCNAYATPANSDVFQLLGNLRDTALAFSTGPDDLGRDLLNIFLDPMPIGTSSIQFWKGRAYAAEFLAGANQTVIWFSEALGFHLWNLNSNFIIVPGRVHMLAPHDTALVIGTDAKVYAYDGQKLDTLADYGVVAGQHWAADGERILFWSLRGLCAFAPFSNLTERQVSVAPGVRAGGCIVRAGGQKRYLSVLQQGGAPFNAL